MTRLSRWTALLLLGVAGTGLAVTCSYDNVPAGTLLVPYFKVSRGAETSSANPIAPVAGGTDTLLAITNVSATGLVAHFTVWNKYSKAVLDFNVPLTGYDVAFASVRQILNLELNMNPLTQVTPSTDVCFTTAGFGKTRYVRFANPSADDASSAGSKYASPALPLSSTFHANVVDSLDESADQRSGKSPGAGTIDEDNICMDESVDGVLSGDFTGYITIDVVNYCTNFTPDQEQYYVFDAIATSGWSRFGYTPNALIGDVFFVDQSDPGNISGDQMVPLEFDTRLEQTEPGFIDQKTFYNRWIGDDDGTVTTTNNKPYDAAYAFIGDGREPLGTHYGFRYLNDTAAGLRSWIVVWRGDLYADGDTNLCNWAAIVRSGGSAKNGGLGDDEHALFITTYDSDENTVTPSGPTTCPSPAPPDCNPSGAIWVFLESSRIDLLENLDFIPGSAQNPPKFRNGWIDVLFPGTPEFEPYFNQAWVGVQHSGRAAFLSVGHGASLLDNQFQCEPNFYESNGNQP